MDVFRVTGVFLRVLRSVKDYKSLAFLMACSDDRQSGVIWRDLEEYMRMDKHYFH